MCNTTFDYKYKRELNSTESIIKCQILIYLKLHKKKKKDLPGFDFPLI